VEVSTALAAPSASGGIAAAAAGLARDTLRRTIAAQESSVRVMPEIVARQAVEMQPRRRGAAEDRRGEGGEKEEGRRNDEPSS
jgi:hypothetical protein